MRKYHEVLPEAHIHLAEDRIFYYRDQVYSNHQDESMRIALVFQRELINHIVPRVMPDLIHCNDWMTGLIPAAARRFRSRFRFRFCFGRGLRRRKEPHNAAAREGSFQILSAFRICA